MRVLDDGTVVQSSLSSDNITSANEIFLKDYSLKRGVVTAIYYPEEKNNLSKEFIEYDVVASEERADGSVSFVTYLRCKTMDLFGSPNNYLQYTLQPHLNKKQGVYEKGAQVLLLALNGNAVAGKSYIVGGYSYPMPKDKKPKKSDGQFYKFAFNGIHITIDKFGQYFLEFNTPIDQNGKKSDAKASGTKISILKDGKLRIEDNEGQFWEIDRVNKKSTWSNGAESIVLNKSKKSVEIVSSGKLIENIKEEKTTAVESKNYNVETKSGSINIKSGKDLKIEAKNNVSIKSGSNWSIESGANVTIKANMFEVKAGNMAKISAQTVQLASGSVPAAGVGISKCLGMGPTGPIMSDIITGSATTLIGS